jgi:hypothetical protein
MRRWLDASLPVLSATLRLIVSPSIIGWIKDIAHSINASLIVVGTALFVRAMLTLLQGGDHKR